MNIWEHPRIQFAKQDVWWVLPQWLLQEQDTTTTLEHWTHGWRLMEDTSVEIFLFGLQLASWVWLTREKSQTARSSTILTLDTWWFWTYTTEVIGFWPMDIVETIFWWMTQAFQQQSTVCLKLWMETQEFTLWASYREFWTRFWSMSKNQLTNGWEMRILWLCKKGFKEIPKSKLDILILLDHLTFQFIYINKTH